MDKVVYITGAGFSAPLGLPVMSNFLLKAKDMYAVNSKKYAHFQEIFEQLDGMARIKHYFSSDLFNIEEILSVLEMERHVGKIDSAESFTRLIRDVIEYYTPELQVTEAEFAGNPEHYLFGETWRLYGYFVLGLLGKRLQVWRDGANKIAKAELVPVNEHHRDIVKCCGLRFDQAATFRSFFSRSVSCIPSLNGAPANTRGRSSGTLSFRQRCCAISKSLNAIVSPLLREPAPLVTR